ncbi:MAG: copper-binding protein [Ignavibacteriales bacterium]
MKGITIIAFVVAVFALLTVGYTEFSITKLQKEQKQMADDIVKLKQEIAKSWQGEQTGNAKSEWPKYHDATGVLRSVSGNRISVDENEIPDFMMAMTMQYEVDNPEQLKGLKEGDKVKFKLKETENDLTVSEIQKQ